MAGCEGSRRGAWKESLCLPSVAAVSLLLAFQTAKGVNRVNMTQTQEQKTYFVVKGFHLCKLPVCHALMIDNATLNIAGVTDTYCSYSSMLYFWNNWCL